jgi:hypothetical protein
MFLQDDLASFNIIAIICCRIIIVLFLKKSRAREIECILDARVPFLYELICVQVDFNF